MHTIYLILLYVDHIIYAIAESYSFALKLADLI